jgi:hypothetical protein
MPSMTSSGHHLLLLITTIITAVSSNPGIATAISSLSVGGMIVFLRGVAIKFRASYRAHDVFAPTLPWPKHLFCGCGSRYDSPFVTIQQVALDRLQCCSVSLMWFPSSSHLGRHKMFGRKGLRSCRLPPTSTVRFHLNDCSTGLSHSHYSSP